MGLERRKKNKGRERIEAGDKTGWREETGREGMEASDRKAGGRKRRGRGLQGGRGRMKERLGREAEGRTWGGR